MQELDVSSIIKRYLVALGLAACVWQSATVGHTGTINRPAKSFGGTSFINGVIPQASDFNGDIDTVYSEFNGNIENANIDASAAISASKINPDGFTTSIRTVTDLPCYILDESDQSADAKRWGLCVTAGQLRLGTLTDAGVVQNNWLTITRANGGFTLGGTSGTNTINGTTTFNQTVTFSGGTSLTPTGMVSMFMGTSAPTGWLLLDGASSSCTGTSSANANLCAQLIGLFGTANYKGSASATVTVDASSNEVLHTSHGKAVNDRVHFSSTTTLPAPISATTVYCIISITADRYKISTTCGGAEVDITDTGTGTHSDYFNFVTPDARGRTPIGTGSGVGLTARTIGATGGEETHTLTGTESGIAQHNHGITDPGHSHVERLSQVSGGSASDEGVGNTNSQCTIQGTCLHNVTSPDSTASATTGISVNNVASTSAASAHAVMDPFMVITYIIKL